MLCSAQIISPYFFTKPSSSGLTYPEVGWGLQLRHYCCRMWHTFPSSTPMWTMSLARALLIHLNYSHNLKFHTETRRKHKRWFSMKEHCLRDLDQMQKLWTTLRNGEIWAGAKSRRILLLIATSRAEYKEGGRESCSHLNQQEVCQKVQWEISAWS